MTREEDIQDKLEQIRTSLTLNDEAMDIRQDLIEQYNLDAEASDYDIVVVMLTELMDACNRPKDE